DNPIDDAFVDVIAAQVCVPVGGLDFHDAFAHLEDGDVKRTAAKVVDGDRLVLFLVEPVGQRGCSGLVDDAEHLEPGNPPGVLGRLALAVVEIRGYGDHRLGDL